MTVFKGGSVNPINQSANKWNIAMGQTVNRISHVGKTHQSTRGHPLVTKRITRGAQSAAQNTGNWPSTGVDNLYPDGKSCRNKLSPHEPCGSCGDGISFCGGPCLFATCVDIIS